MQEILNKTDLLISELMSLQPLKAEYEKKLDKKFRLEFNYNSNHIEGNTLTYGHTELLLIFDKVSGDYDAREIEEMKAHDLALTMVKELANEKDRDLTETFIRQLNEIILVRPFWKEALTHDGQPTRRLIEPGTYKKFPNSVLLANGEMFDYASPEETPALMHDFMDFYRSHTGDHPIFQAAMIHYKFVRIHPFDDGNGRVARLLMNYIMFKHGLPPIIIKSKEKKEYITALNKADAKDLDAFISYIADKAIWSLDISIKVARGEDIDEVDDLDKEIALLRKDLKKENVLSREGNVESIVEALHENIIPLFRMIEEKCEDLKDLFFDYDRKMIYTTANTTSALGSKESNWDTLIANWLIKRVKNGNERVSYFKYTYTFKGFKKNINAPNCEIVIEILFNEYNYTIWPIPPNRKAITAPYGKKMSDEEMQAFYTPLIKDLIEDIKRFNEQ